MSDFRPRLSLTRVGEIWGFSRWLILSRFTMLLNRQFDRWVVGSIGGAAVMGNYFIAQDFASSPSDEIVAPMSRAAFPVYSRLRSDPAALADALRRMLSSVTAVTFATGLGMAAVANDFVHVVLGDKWVGAIPLMPWLGLFAAVYGVVRTLDMFLIATGGGAGIVIAGPRASPSCSFLCCGGRVRPGSVVGSRGDQGRFAFVLVAALAFVVTRNSQTPRPAVGGGLAAHGCGRHVMFVGVKALQAELPLTSHFAGVDRGTRQSARSFTVPSAS